MTDSEGASGHGLANRRGYGSMDVDLGGGLVYVPKIYNCRAVGRNPAQKLAGRFQY
jgi:hypothetical protein